MMLQRPASNRKQAQNQGISKRTDKCGIWAKVTILFAVGAKTTSQSPLSCCGQSWYMQTTGRQTVLVVSILEEITLLWCTFHCELILVFKDSSISGFVCCWSKNYKSESLVLLRTVMVDANNREGRPY
jgi:hypothetical protein